MPQASPQLSAQAGRSIPATSNADINALLGGIVDRKKWYWYDTLKFAPGTTVVQTPYSWFTSPVGGQDPNNASAIKTLLETNLTGNGQQFSSPYDMVLTNLGFLFALDNDIYDIGQVVKYGYMAFSILEKTFFKGHLWRHPPGAGFSGATAKSGQAVWNNGIPDPGAIYYFGQWSKYIPPLTTFGLTLTFFETVGMAMTGSNTGTLGATATAYAQSAAALPTLLTTGQGGNGIWLIGFMNGLSDGPVA